MSTIKVTNLQNASAASPAIVLDANSRATLNGLSYPTEGSLSGRNRIINGGMDVWQRGTSFTPINNAVTYGADRWFAFTTSGTGQARILQNGSVPAGFAYSLALGRQSGNTATAQQFICQCVESANILGLAGQQVTLSFYALKGANYSGGNLSVILSTGTTADQSSATFSGGPCTGYTGNTAVINTTQAITTSWVRYTFTGTVPANALSLGIGIGYTPSGTAGADDNVYITGVQLEAGSVATPFERRSYGQELMLCQRYFKPFGVGGYGRSGSTTLVEITAMYGITMRATPTITFGGFSGANTTLDQFGTGSITASAVTSGFGNQNGCYLSFTVSGATNTAPCAIVRGDVASASAEL